MFANSLEILVFTLVGIIVVIPITPSFILTSLALFGLYILIRALSVWATFSKDHFTFREKLFISLNVQKGIAVAVVALTLSTMNIPGIQPVLNLSLAFFIYSLLLSTIVIKAAPLFGMGFFS